MRSRTTPATTGGGWTSRSTSRYRDTRLGRRAVVRPLSKSRTGRHRLLKAAVPSPQFEMLGDYLAERRFVHTELLRCVGNWTGPVRAADERSCPQPDLPPARLLRRSVRSRRRRLSREWRWWTSNRNPRTAQPSYGPASVPRRRHASRGSRRRCRRRPIGRLPPTQSSRRFGVLQPGSQAWAAAAAPKRPRTGSRAALRRRPAQAARPAARRFLPPSDGHHLRPKPRPRKRYSGRQTRNGSGSRRRQ